MVLAHAVAMSTGGMPLLYLGDEVAQLNDYYYRDRPAEAGDSRWVNRPFRPEVAYAARHDPATTAGRVFSRLHRLLQVRSETPELGGNDLIPFRTPHPSVLAFHRPGSGGVVLVLANFGDDPVRVDAPTLSGFAPEAVDLVADEALGLADGVALGPHAFLWLRVVPVA